MVVVQHSKGDIEMIYRVNNKVLFVQGAKNGAIYNFNTGKVYSVNDSGCDIIKDYVIGKTKVDEDSYLKLLDENQLISRSFTPCKYLTSNRFDVKLEMAWIEITQKCNLKCVHCYEGNEHMGFKNVLSIAEWKCVIDQLAAEKINRLIVIGGEPCCNRDTNEILSYAAQYPIDITLFTNATLIDEQLFKTIVDKNIRVKISIYGPNADIHDKVTTVKGSFDKLVATVQRLKDKSVDVTSSIVVMKENEEYIDQTVEFVKSIGMNFKKYDVIRNVYGGTQSEHTPVSKKALDVAYFKKPNFWTSEEQFERNFALNTCWYGKIAVMENGDVIPCEFERNYKYGNIRNNTIREILEKDETISKWWLNFDKIDVCRDCEYRYACRDCRALGISVCGSMTSKNPRCLYNPYSGEWNGNEEKNNSK